MIKLFVILLAFCSSQQISQDVLTEKYKTLEITGDMKSLSVIGEDRDDTVIEFSNNKKNENNSYDVVKRLTTLYIEFNEPEKDIIVRVPKNVNINVEPTDIVFEGLFDVETDQRKITIKDISGSIDVTTDGYKVDLLRNSNNMSVVSYFDIFADSIDVKWDGSISMDSYWGDVSLRSIEPLDAQINMRAKQGFVELDSMIKIAEGRIMKANNISVIVGDGNADILLHSEKGKQVLLNMQDVDMQMKSLEKEMFRVNEDIRLRSRSDKDLDGYEMLQNDPNPWKKETKIQYLLPEDKGVFFTFYAVDGTTIYTILHNGKKGINTLKVDRKMVPNIGVSYYKMEVGEFNKTMKMIHID